MEVHANLRLDETSGPGVLWNYPILGTPSELYNQLWRDIPQQKQMAQMAQNDFLNPKKVTYVLWAYRYDLYLYHSISKYGPNRNDTFANLKSFAQLIDDPLHQLSKFG